MLNTREIAISLAAFMTCACSHVPRATKDGRLLDWWGSISTRDYVRTRGVGAAPSEARGQTRRRGLSRAAALGMARYELLGVISGIKVSGGVTVAQLAERDSLIRELADDLVRGAHEVMTEWTTEDACVVTLELRRATVEKLIAQKSQRERDLERRLVRAIDEARKADLALEVATMSDRDRRRWATAGARADDARRLAERADRLERMVDRFDPANGSHNAAILNEIVDFANAIERTENPGQEEMNWSPVTDWGFERSYPAYGSR